MNWGLLKQKIRKDLFPAGEAPQLVAAHDKQFIDGIIDLQTWVDCMQFDNTNVVAQCATLYNCGLTILPAPRGNIKKLEVVDRINVTTGKEDATAPIDYCCPIRYEQIDMCHIRQYLMHSARRGCCLSIPLFFGLDPLCCRKAFFPVPTDEGVAKNLPFLPLGFHYAQTSTDRTWGRSQTGVWAMERGKIFIAPWIESTETVIITWDGIKRTWDDLDLIDDDPLLEEALLEYVRWKHADRYDHDQEEAAAGAQAFDTARTKLWHQCREETRVRGCEPSHARGIGTSAGSLFYNIEQSASAQCHDGTVGDPVTVTIPAGTVASNVSVSDANQKAKDEAQRQAQARLDCAGAGADFTNDAQTAVLICVGLEDHPLPDGQPVTVTVPAGTVHSTVSKSEANANALALAQQQAAAKMQCTYWNKEVSYTATCPAGHPGSPVTKTVAAHTFHSDNSFATADALALNSAKTQAEQALVCTDVTTYVNTKQTATVQVSCSRIDPNTHRPIPCTVGAQVSVMPGTVSSTISQGDANQQALNLARNLATQKAAQLCTSATCGSTTSTQFP